MKCCCFRFDADTHVCVSQGIPRLVEVADDLGVKFTFFVNMGRAFAPTVSFARALNRVTTRKNREFISAGRKLGWRESITAAIFNPQAGRSHPAALRAAKTSGHEIGLHGGRNHAHWERNAHLWTQERLRDEIETALRWMAECGLLRPVSFASPAWNSPPFLQSLLPSLRFRILADTYQRSAPEANRRAGRLIHVCTNVTAPSGSAGYLETLCAKGWSKKQIVQNFREQLAQKDRQAMVYDHPFFAGVHASGVLRELVNVAINEGFHVCTVSAAVERIEGALLMSARQSNSL